MWDDRSREYDLQDDLRDDRRYGKGGRDNREQDGYDEPGYLPRDEHPGDFSASSVEAISMLVDEIPVGKLDVDYQMPLAERAGWRAHWQKGRKHPRC